MADFLTKLKRLGRGGARQTNSIYSMVSCSDVTPGSLEVWLDLPDEIKYDPSLAPFKQLYEQRHGKLERSEQHTEGDKTIGNGKTTDSCIPSENGNEVTKDCENGLMDQMLPEKENKKKSTKKKQINRMLRVIKLGALVACWGLLTVSLLLNMETSDVVLHTAVEAGSVKEYELSGTSETAKVLVTLAGPFEEAATNDSNSLLFLCLRKTPNKWAEYELNSSVWTVRLKADDVMDFAASSSDARILELQSIPHDHHTNTSRDHNSTKPASSSIANNVDIEGNDSKVRLCVWSTSNNTVPITVSYHVDPISEDDGIVYASLLLASLYILIIFEVVNRTIAALLSSSLGIAVLALGGARPSLPELVSWLDVETLLLLFSMMLLVAILAETGLFDYLAVLAFEVTGGRTWPLINCLCFFTAFFSTFLDNVTTVLLMTPVTIRLCEVMQLNPVPVLMSMVIFSNVGGAATPVGDPPNVIIASHPSILHENINFTTFTLHMGAGILLVAAQTYLQLRYMFRDMNALRHTVPRDIQELRQELAVWRRAAASLASYSRDEDIVRRALEKKVQKLHATLQKRESGSGRSKSDPLFCSTLAQMKQKYRIRDKPLLVKSAVCVAFVVVVFFLHAIPELQRLSLGWTALLGALLLLLLAEREDLEPVLARVEWSTLLFFAALFVLMEALSKLGLISWIGRMTESVILQVNEESRLTVALLLILWVSGVASAFVDNIPLTTMMVRVTAALSSPAGLALPLAPLAYALSFGACLGGNGTLIGASANVVCAGVAEQHGYRFSFLQYLKVGFPIMIGNLMVASVYLLFCHSIFQWH
ncbi:PREDICTED: P protein-like isoform X4 [Papilio xuthus]|uniref:P protein-like isoform X4 n=1 Tax=Papilio xuthus TaxID=66420 RepID=A0AAJ6ZQ00_PAPXU|nr:PREDICTED: P protein-like isoform X4 [Papilio xuthus]XP_013177019.1 PREDICTED: P protein-like isoform X4 [Papilio xuthus]XP_013177020.1 PREDICTED: P protein-like isoform X4 [Papilio xuthus]XP_013177021.1 PREDICTED: P protein-like isoform X4 [Papilio xuthus]XP_013177022.1 PREDICTED: P protein-like isoform X4 [Papilio xuthus]